MDDTLSKLRSVLPLIDLQNGHYIGLLENGDVGEVITHEHALTHHAEQLERGDLEPVQRQAPEPESVSRRGPAKVNSNKYRDNYDRIFASGPVGEA